MSPRAAARQPTHAATLRSANTTCCSSVQMPNKARWPRRYTRRCTTSASICPRSCPSRKRLMPDLAAQINAWTERLRAIALTGLAFEPALYDRERYEDLLRLAANMATTAADLRTDSELSQQ